MGPLFRGAPRWLRRVLPFSWYREYWWNLDAELCRWLLPELRKMQKNWHGRPDCLTHEEWQSVLDDMVEGFALQADHDDLTQANQAKIQRAFDLLAKHHWSLWD